MAALSGLADAARILAVIPTPSRSHYIWNRALILALAKKGHQVTVLSPDAEKEPVPNLKLMFLEDSYASAHDLFVYEDLVKVGKFGSVELLWTWGIECCRQQMDTKGAKELLKMPPDSFDLIIMETVLSDCMYVYIHHFGGGTRKIPPLTEIGSNISLILVNNHYVINGPQPLLPGIIEVGGMQCTPAKPLPKDITEFLDGSPKGAIFFSLGSNLRSEFLPKEKLHMIVRTFAALNPQIRVLWKFDPDTPIENLPPNVLLRKWLQQEDVLGHPKTVLFITHGGLLSTQESIYHGVPMVGVPFFADQRTNVRRMVELKVAKEVNILTTNEGAFTEAITRVIGDEMYRQNMRRLSRLFRDHPQTPLECAIFWTEFVLRHDKGRIESLRAPGHDLAWYQYFMLDVFAVIFMFVLISLFVLIILIQLIYKLISKSLHSDNSSEDPKKERLVSDETFQCQS
ncbi:hypothetical protein J437_LFUL018357 [Ladona fulva]|uniref:UDP-glucuronosyltransferase n=1 Tax=Ladona fulva TaxID=123851 RepID=A0A8K0KUQ1_LADFU|nr:hypothetical protein J437_LFUL018357 [Ladona fulva]